MRDLILFTTPGTCSTGPHILLESLNIPYYICLVDNNILNSDGYAKINPLKLVAALRHGDFILYENSAILAYLTNKYSPASQLVSQNNPERFGKIMQWMSFLTTTVHGNFARHYHPERYISKENIADLLKYVITNLNKNYSLIETHLKEQKFLVDDNYTICDFEAYAILRWAFNDKILNAEQYPAITRYLKEIKELPLVNNVSAIENMELSKLVNSQFLGYIDVK